MFGRDLIVMGASAGGIRAFRHLLAFLPPSLPASVLIVQHTSPHGPGLLPSVIGRDAALPVRLAIDGEEVQPGQVCVAPPDHHLIVRGPRLHLSRAPRENRQRPAIDTLFRSAAESYGRRTVGVVLTGYLDDGTAGLASIKMHGGIAVVQSPDDAEAPAMPSSALHHVQVDHCLPLSEIGPLLVQIASDCTIPDTVTPRVRPERPLMTPEEMTAKLGPPTGFTCPECDGALWEAITGDALQFRCHIGHLYSPECLLADHADKLEATLWSVVRTLDAQASLMRRLAQRKILQSFDDPDLEERARHCERQAEVMRALFEDKARDKGQPH
jgi:two-component system, chemotaxis family, protein-glutamate methylesterase/glutaminase